MSDSGSDLEQFLAALWPEIPENHWILFWGAPSKRSAWIQHLGAEEVVSLSIWAQKENVYIGCATRSQQFGVNARGKRADCAAIPGVWLDVDYGGPEHKKPNLPPTEADARALIDSLGLVPSIIVHSGRGLQAWWLFKEPWIFESDDDRDSGERLTKGWVDTCRVLSHDRGWDADEVGDLPRVMRMPGLWNRKGVPVKTRLLYCNPETRYNPSDFEPFLTVVSTGSKPVVEVDWKIEKSPSAEPPSQKFLLLCEHDSEFKRLCLRIPLQGQKDHSASGFDFLLAQKAFAANWEAQEVVNLLICQRRTHKADLKLQHPSYYQKTLSSAFHGTPEIAREKVIEDLKAGKAMPEEVAKDPAEILAVISGMLGVTITKIIKYQGEVGTYEVEVNGKTVRLGEVNLLTSQRALRNRIADIAGIWFTEQAKPTWDHTVRLMLQVVESVEVGQESTTKGALAGILEGYLSDGVALEERADEALLQHQPAIKNGAVWFTLTGLRQHLFGQYQDKVTAQTLAVQLRAMGYQSRTEHLTDRRKKVRTTKIVWGHA
jgi:hypothetical protein